MQDLQVLDLGKHSRVAARDYRFYYSCIPIPPPCLLFILEAGRVIYILSSILNVVKSLGLDSISYNIVSYFTSDAPI